ncbi:MAG: (Fe-S)-binding protein [Fimbriimonadales bacterium]
MPRKMTPSREEFLHIGNGKYLFYALIYLALGIMAWQIARRVRLWMQGRPVEPRPAGPRYWIPTSTDIKRWLGNFCIYVLAQRKVRSSRRKSGAPMHLLIFYGFLSLFLATTILAVNTYGPWKFHRGRFYEVYETTFDLLGLLFVFGLLWALIRRILLDWSNAKAQRSQSRNAEGPQSSIVNRQSSITSGWGDYATLALLIVIGLTGYWLEAARISNSPKPWDGVSVVGYRWAHLQGTYSDAMYVFVWWFHVAWILIFFVTLPRMRIRHLVMAILTTAGRSDKPLGELTPISMAEVEQTGQIGVATAKDYSRWHLMSLDACMECGRCTEACPAWNVGKVLNPKQVVQNIRGAMADGSNVAEKVSEEALWACTTCNACVEACPVLIRHVDMIVDARRWLVAEGKLSGTGATMLRQVASTNHAWGQPRNSREDWMKGLDIPLCRDGVEFEWLFWVGCAGATDPGAVKTTKAVAQLLKKAGVSFACLGQLEACTGDPARRIGDEFLFQEKAMGNAAVFQQYKVKKIVTPCPHCFNTLKNEYGQIFPLLEPDDPNAQHPTPNASLTVMHHSQLLAQLVGEGKLKAADGSGTVFHDPCYLARINNESDAPRAIFGEQTSYNEALSPEAPLVGPDPRSKIQNPNFKEPSHRARKTLCCGAGGGRMWLEEPPTQRPSNRRAEELVATGASIVAVGCPFCRIMLGDALKQVTDKEISLLDLAEALQKAND